MDGDDAPRALDAKLLEESSGHDALVGHERVRVQQSTADDADEDDAEATAEDGGAVPNHCSAADGPEVGHDLRDGDGVGREVVLVGDHGGVEVLRAVRHEVEAGHKEHHIDQEEPVPLEGNFSFLEEDLGGIGCLFADSLAFKVGIRLREPETEEDDQDGGPSTEPEELGYC